MGREIEFSATKMSDNLIKKYSYIRSSEVRIEADHLIVDKKPMYEISLYLNGDTKPNLKINYPADGVETNVVESLKNPKASLITPSHFLEIVSQKASLIDIVDNTMVVRANKKTLANEVSIIYTFKGMDLVF